MTDQRFPSRCPSCGGEMEAVRLHCSSCGTEVQGRYRPCPVCRLDGATRELFERFLDARGNLKDVQRALGVSYPTVRLRIDEMFRKLGRSAPTTDPKTVLQGIRDGEITVEEAERLLRGD